MVCSALISLLPSSVTGEDYPISVWITGWTCLLHFWLLYKSSFSSDVVLDCLFHDLIGQFRSTSWCETQASSPTSCGLSILSPDQRRGKLLHWSHEKWNLAEMTLVMTKGYENPPQVCDSYIPVCMNASCLLHFDKLQSCSVPRNVVVHAYVEVYSVYMPSCLQDNWIIVTFIYKTNRQRIYLVCLLFPLPGTGNESLEQNFSDLLISFVWI